MIQSEWGHDIELKYTYKNETVGEIKTYTMRIPKTLYEKLEREAERRKRSVNFIVNEKLEKAYKNDNRR